MALYQWNIYSLLGLVVVGALLWTLYLALRPSPLNKIPGPWLSRFTNARLKLAVISGRRIHYIHSLHATYGPYVRISPTEIAVNDPKGFQQIHAIGGGFEKSTWYNETTNMPRPTLFAMQDAKSHAQRRRLFARGFSKTNVRSNWEGEIKAKIELAVRKIKQEGEKGVVDVMKWWTLMASDVSSHLMFGESFRTLEKGETNEYIRTLTKALKGNGIGAELPLIRTVGRYLPFQATKELFRTNDTLDSFADLAIRNARQEGGEKNVFAQIQAEAEKGEEGKLDDITVKAEATSMFVAGTDTTAVSLTYLIWAVLKRPGSRKRVEEEVSTLPEGYSDADVEKLPLLNSVIEETLRLYGAAPGALPRVVPAGGREVGGYYLPQGTIVSTHAYSLHRDPEIFPEPFEFKPERFLTSLSPAAKAVFTPFGPGARTCLGVHIAYSELRLASAEFFRECPESKVAEETTEEGMEFENFFLIAPRGHGCGIVVGGRG